MSESGTQSWAALWSHWDPSPDATTSAALEQAVSSALHTAHRKWPTLALEDAVFAGWMVERVADHGEPLRFVESLHTNDLYLACACALGHAAGLRVLDRQYLPCADAVHHRLTGGGDEAEFRQNLRDRLLVRRPDQAARIAGYSGRGALRSWIRISAHRMLVDGLRARQPQDSPGAAAPDDMADGRGDPEVAVLKATYRDGFRQAFDHAFGLLTPRERALLRFRHVEQLEVQQIAVILGRHRVSVSRALGKARERLMTHLRQDVATRLGLGPSEANSIIQLLRSEIEVSLSRLLSPDQK